MRKMMTKEVTKTIVKLGKLEMVEGSPQAVMLPDEVILGNVSVEKAQRILNKKFETPVTIFGVSADTEVYEMAVEDFIKVATIKTEEVEEEVESEE
jgi:hypothetical protein